jgi:hypothetical protein
MLCVNESGGVEPAKAKPRRQLKERPLYFSGDGTGLVLVAGGCLLAIVSAIVASWVVLVEVLR